jgi:ABC-type lipoprotein export system ATPase subunit
MAKPLVICDNLVKIYKVSDLEVVALQGLDLEVASGEMLAIVGASGSGKSTLLNILSGLDIPSAGRATVSGYDLTRLTEMQRIHYRRFMIGHVWQQSGRNLLQELTSIENIEAPQLIGGYSAKRRMQRCRELLDLVELQHLAHKYPNQLSGGEQQRIAIAVSLANEPRLLLADEPTGELDSVTAGEIITLLHSLSRKLGLTIIVVTHDAGVATVADRTIAIRDGRTSTETVRREAPQADANGLVTLANTLVGLSNETHRESVLIDRVGRLQLPKEALERILFNGRAEVRIADDHVELWPAETNGNGQGETPEATTTSQS